MAKQKDSHGKAFLARFRKSKAIPYFFVVPALFFFILVFLFSLLTMFTISFYEFIPGSGTIYSSKFTLENYLRFFHPLYQTILITTLKIGAVSSFVSIFLGYPIAYSISRSKSSGTRRTLLASVVIFLFTIGIVRIYGLLTILGNYGLVNNFLASLGMDRLQLCYNENAVIIGAASYVIPFVILSLMGSIYQIDPVLEEAARSLGANDVQTFLKVTLPLSIPGIVSASLLSFTMGISVFTTPIVLGGGAVTMMSNFIFTKITVANNFPVASASAAMLLVISLTISFVISRVLESKIKRG